MTFRLSHIAALAAVSILLVGLGGIAATWLVADREFREVLDDDLEQRANLLGEIVTRTPMRLDDEHFAQLLADVFVDNEEETLWVSIYDRATGQLLSNFDHDLPLESKVDGALRRELGGYGWEGVQSRVGDIVVQLLRRDDLYDDVRDDMLEQIVAPAFLGGVATLLLAGALIALLVKPLTRLSRELEARGPDSLHRLTTATPAREIVVLRDSINGLIAGIEDALRRERHFVSDVAHELRTPLTTLKLELASAEPDLAAARAEVDRLARLVEELLTLARLENGRVRKRFERLALDDLCTGVVASFRERYLARSMRLEERISSPVFVEGDATLLEILLRNLLRNVLDHCPDGTRVEVMLSAWGGRALLRVADDGPGIAAETRERLPAGFARLEGRSGAGLGLAICQRIVAVHGGELRFLAAEAGSGLVVEVGLPA
jgi:signal transduction histidine kinase